MLSTAEDNISSSTIAAGDGREVATAAAAAANTTTASHSHNLPSGRSEADNKGQVEVQNDCKYATKNTQQNPTRERQN